MVNIPHKNQMCVYTYMYYEVAYLQTPYMFWYKVAQCIMRDTDQSKIAVVFMQKR
jgi:Na+-driven multidrug efflux pump